MCPARHHFMMANQVLWSGVQTRDEAAKQLEESKKTGEAQWNAAQKQYQKATPANQKASKKTWNLAQKARDEVKRRPVLCISCFSSIGQLFCSPFNFCCAKLNVHCSWCMPLGVATGSTHKNQKFRCMCGTMECFCFLVTQQHVLLLQANQRLSQAEKELAKAFDHARGVAERRSQKEEL